MLDEEKRRLRAAARRARAAAAATSPGAGEEVAAMVAEALGDDRIPLAKGAPVSAYWPKGDELDPRPLMALLAERGHPIGLPVVTGPRRPLTFRRWTPGASLVPAGFGLLEPPDDCPEVIPEVLFVPLLAFDRAGWRLGYGGGFYDRTLAGLQRTGRPLAVGLAYAGQELFAVPHGPDDRRLDRVATERTLSIIDEADNAPAVLR